MKREMVVEYIYISFESEYVVLRIRISQYFLVLKSIFLALFGTFSRPVLGQNYPSKPARANNNNNNKLKKKKKKSSRTHTHVVFLLVSDEEGGLEERDGVSQLRRDEDDDGTGALDFLFFFPRLTNSLF